MDNLIESWTKYLLYEHNYSDNTINAYLADLHEFHKFLLEYSNGSISLAETTKQDMRSWILYRQKNGHSFRSITRGISAIKNLHKFMLEKHIINNSDIIGMKSPKITKTLPRPLTISQLDDIIGAVNDIKNTSWIIKRDRAVLVLIYSVGLRISEALNIKSEDFLHNSGFINIVGKGGKHRSVPIIDSVYGVIHDYLRARPYSSQFLFVNRYGEQLHATTIQKLLQKARRLLNLSENITPHALRHTCATHIMENSGKLREVQELLGHSSLNSTQIYADITQKYLLDTYEKCHPLGKILTTPKDKANI